LENNVEIAVPIPKELPENINKTRCLLTDPNHTRISPYYDPRCREWYINTVEAWQAGNKKI